MAAIFSTFFIFIQSFLTLEILSSLILPASEKEKKQCFEEVLTAHFTRLLQRDTIVVTQDIKDTLLLQLQISEKGVLSVLNIKVDSLTSQEIPNIKDLLLHG